MIVVTTEPVDNKDPEGVTVREIEDYIEAHWN